MTPGLLRIGMTYDLREDYLASGYRPDEVAEFDSPQTIAAIESVLRDLGHRPERIGHARRLAARLVAGERWDLVFNIAEGMHGFGREALVPALLESYEIPCVFSDPLVCALTLHKAMAKRVLRDAGIPTPDFFLVEREADVPRIEMPFPLFAKPVAEGTSKGVDRRSKVKDPRELAALCGELLERYRQPVLVERYLPGRELTVGVLGTGPATRALGALEVVLLDSGDPEIYTYANKEDCEIHVSYELARGPLADEACELAVRTWQVLGARDGGRVDVRADENGRLAVLEANPLPGLHPDHSDLPILCKRVGVSYRELIASILESALERVGEVERRNLGSCAS